MGLYAFDGTWNTEKDNDSIDLNTNVVRFRNAYSAKSGTNDFYVEGIGTRHKAIGRVIGGMFGVGEVPRMNEAYDHLCKNWAAGDKVIDVIGFSRGAATALDFCELIQERHIRRPGTKDVVSPNPEIRFLGLWDVVPAFGAGFLGNTLLNFGHNMKLPKSSLKYCFHALALDEKRLPFIPVRLVGAYEVWFRGVHSDIGGGNGNLGLNDISLKWMMCKAKAASLPIADADIQALRPDPNAEPNKDRPLLDIRNVVPADRRHYTAIDRDGWRCVDDVCVPESEVDEVTAKEIGANGIETLPEDQRRRARVMWDTAVKRAEDLHQVTLDRIAEPLQALIQCRVPLVIDDDKSLQKAKFGVAMLIDLMMHEAKQKGWSKPDEFFLNLALANRRHLFPFTD
jgi:hypothetical protein